MKNLKVCIASSALVAALALVPASALAEGTTPAPTSTTGATATTGVTPIPAPTREQLMDPTVNPYAPEDATSFLMLLTQFQTDLWLAMLTA